MIHTQFAKFLQINVRRFAVKVGPDAKEPSYGHSLWLVPLHGTVYHQTCEPHRTSYFQ